MIKKQFMLTSLFIASIAASNSVSAGAIVNGNFSSGSTGWAVLDSANDPTPLGANGAVSFGGGQAVLATGAGIAPYSAAIDQGFTNSLDAITLGAIDSFFKFDALFTRIGADISELQPTSFPNDSLNVLMYDMNSASVYSIANIDYSTAATQFSFDLSAYIGLTVGFSFELADANDGYNSQVALSNILIEQRTAPSTVPVPGTLLLVIIGWFGLTKNLLRNDRKVQC